MFLKTFDHIADAFILDSAVKNDYIRKNNVEDMI